MISSELCHIYRELDTEGRCCLIRFARLSQRNGFRESYKAFIAENGGLTNLCVDDMAAFMDLWETPQESESGA